MHLKFNNEDWDFKVFILFQITFFDSYSHKFRIHLLICRSKRYIAQRPENDESCHDCRSTFVFWSVRARPGDWWQHYVESLFQVCRGDPGMLRFLRLYESSPAWKEQMSDLLRRRVHGMFEKVQISLESWRFLRWKRSNKISCNKDTN